LQEIQIQNIVATAKISDSLDLNLLIKILPDIKYDHTRFPGVIYRLDVPKVTFLLFTTGKLVCTGAKTREDIEMGIHNLIEKLSDSELSITKNPTISIQNIVATYDLKTKMDLNFMSISFGLENIEYEPELFPGLVYRLFDPKVVFLIFNSGKIVCTGGKSIEDAKSAVKSLKEDLSSFGLID